MTLFRNHALVAIRMMRRHKLFTLINVFGLTLSMIIGLVLLTIIIDQKSFDKFHVNYDNIYRITTKSKFQQFSANRLATSTIPLAVELTGDQIEEVVRIRRSLSTDLISPEADKTLPIDGHYADANFFTVFSFDMIMGDPATALKEPFSIVITEKLVRRIFDRTDVLGTVVELEDLGLFTITGILTDPPRRSHMQFDILASFATVPILEDQQILWPTIDNWQDYSSSYLYFLKREKTDLGAIQANLDRISAVEYEKYPDLEVDFAIQPLSGIALGADMSNQIGPTTEKEFIIGVSILAFIIFLAAIFNYTNLSVARSLKRGREVGIRKVMGSTRGNITSQFILESVIVALIALGCAMIFFELLKPALLPFMPNNFLSLDLTPQILLAFLFFALVAGLISGTIPAAVMSRLNISHILKHGSGVGNMSRINFRKGVLAFQFTLSMIFIIVAIVAWRQYQFGIDFDTGFKKDGIFNVYLQGNDPERIRAEYLQLPEVHEVSFSGFVLARGTVQNTWVKIDSPLDSMLVRRLRVDHRFPELHEIELLAGQSFSQSGGQQALVNGFVLDYFGMSDPEQAIGRKLVTSDGFELEIVGVTTNFYHEDVHRTQGGFYLHFSPDNSYAVANLAVDYNDAEALRSKIATVWGDVDRGVHDFNGAYFSEQIKASYDGLTFILKFVGTLAILVISIAVLGLLGIVIYTVENRVREIGIRKAMGASEGMIMRLLSSGFLKLVGISALVAITISYFLVFHVILRQMVDKPDIGAMEFVVALFLLMIPSAGAIIPAVLKASKTNPALILRNE